LLILDGHGNHVTLEAIEQVKEFGLNMITLSSHTSPFKIAFKKIRDATMFRNNHMEPEKITLVRSSLNYNNHSQKKIKFMFKTIGIWPLNPKAMDNKTRH
jgi:hypothetical protein